MLELPGVEEQMRQVASGLTFRRVGTAGHWVQLEARDELNEILKAFFEGKD
jgi:pimeloyl-ACP methyl ester carboxylesterase